MKETEVTQQDVEQIKQETVKQKPVSQTTEPKTVGSSIGNEQKPVPPSPPRTQFDSDELEKIKNLQQKYLEIQAGYGQVKLSRLRLEEQLQNINDFETNLNKEYAKTQKKEKSILKHLTDKYGDGQLDPTTGVFTQAKT